VRWANVSRKTENIISVELAVILFDTCNQKFYIIRTNERFDSGGEMKKSFSLLLGIYLLLMSGSITKTQEISPVKRIQSNQVALSFPCPTDVEEPEGLAFGQGYLWFASQTQGIYKLDPSDGSVVAWIPMPEGLIEIHGLAHDGTYLWAAAYDDNLYQIDPADGSVVRSLPAPGGDYREGLAWDGTYLWFSRDDKQIYKIDPSTGAVVDSIATGSLDPEGLAFGDGYVWEGGWDNKISKIDPLTGSIVSSFSGPGNGVSGLAWDGGYLWADCPINKMIYKIDVMIHGEVWVDDDFCSGCSNGGHLWGLDAFDTIQDGIDALDSGGTVHVAEGTYYENIDFEGKAVAVISEAGPARTIIHGNGIGDVVIGATGGTIQGFTITGSGLNWYNCGIEASLATMTIKGNVITGNWLGINTSNYREPLIVNNLICDNIHFGIVASYYSKPIIVNNTIVLNGEDGIASQSGKGIVSNNIICMNANFGISCTMPISQPEFRHNDVYGNGGVNYFGCGPGEGDIFEEPLFIDSNNRNFHLKKHSPCIDAGIMTDDVPDTDIDGMPRPNPSDSPPDMGAYERSKFVYLTMSATEGGRTRPKLGERKYVSGKTAVLKAIPDKGYRFSHWSGDAEGIDNQIKIRMDANKSVKAHFTEQ